MNPGRIHIASMALTMVMVAGCVSAPHQPTPPRVNVPVNWQQPVAVSSSPVPAQWWEALSDPVLNALIGRSLADAPDIQTALARLRQSRALAVQAGAARWPQLSAGLSASHTSGQTSLASAASGTTGGNQFQANLDASWEVDVFGGLTAGARAADASLNASRENLRDARVSLQAEVVSDYVTLRAAQARQDIAEASAESETETLQLIRWRQQAGLTDALDVEQASTAVEQARAQAAVWKASAMQALRSLELLLGLPPGGLAAELGKRQPLPTLPEVRRVALPADVLRQRPDVRAAADQWIAQVALTDQAHANRFPSLSLSGTLTLESLSASRLGDGGLISLAAGLTAPVFDAGNLAAKQAQQQAVQDQYAVAYRQAVLSALTDVENALIGLQGSGDQAAALARADVSARTASDLSRLRYQAGLTDFTTLLTSERTQLAVADSLAAARADLLKSWVALYKAVGGGETNVRTSEEASSD